MKTKRLIAFFLVVLLLTPMAALAGGDKNRGTTGQGTTATGTGAQGTAAQPRTGR